MAEAENKAIVRRYYDEVLTSRNLKVADELFASDFLSHLAWGEVVNLVTYLQAVGMSHSAFPDLQVTIEDQIAEGNKVAKRWKAHGTQTGVYMGISLTGRVLTVSAIHIHRLADSRLVEHWEQFDTLGALQQLGVLSTPGASGS
jgi:predicted ester cyclase